MKKTLSLFLFSLVALFPAGAATASLPITSPVSVGSTIDVPVEVTNLDDTLVAFGFDVTVNNSSVFQYLGETPNSAVFTDLSGFPGGPDVVAFVTDPSGLDPASLSGPLTLATLQFQVLAPGTTNINVTYDPSDPNQGLVYLTAPYGALNASTTVTAAAAPEPSTLLPLALLLGGLCLVRRPARSR